MQNNFIQSTIQAFLKDLPSDATLHVAYSGGVDSHVLLHAIVAARESFPALIIKAIHLNHQLQHTADQWALHCQQQCQDLNITCCVEKVNAAANSGESPEAAARKARYQVFSTLLKPGEYLLTAQHLDDQAETVLLQLMRGAGVKGLAAMPLVNAFVGGYLARPLLNTSQQAILDYAKAHQLNWVEDQSNQDVDFDRNFLRHRVLPLLRERRPNVENAMARSASHCAEANELLTELAVQDLSEVQLEASKILSAGALKKLSMPRLRNVLRFWLQAQHCLLPSAVKLEHIISDVVFSRHEAKPSVEWGGVAVIRHKDQVMLAT